MLHLPSDAALDARASLEAFVRLIEFASGVSMAWRPHTHASPWFVYDVLNNAVVQARLWSPFQTVVDGGPDFEELVKVYDPPLNRSGKSPR
jgi:hypothetical protein